MDLKDIVLHEMSDIEKTNIVCYRLYVEEKNIKHLYAFTQSLERKA